MTSGVFIALGSNIGDRYDFLSKAISLLGKQTQILIVKQSTFIETEPVGLTEQGLFLNGVLEITTSFSPSELLATCLSIEVLLGRTRAERWGPRTIDLDIILFGDQNIVLPNLKIPHPELHNRAFVLEPLAEIAPHVVHPKSKLSATQMLHSCNNHVT